MKEPSYKDSEYCISLRKISKTTGILSLEQTKFCEKMWKEYPEWYKKTQEQINIDTRPFGSI